MLPPEALNHIEFGSLVSVASTIFAVVKTEAIPVRLWMESALSQNSKEFRLKLFRLYVAFMGDH